MLSQNDDNKIEERFCKICNKNHNNIMIKNLLKVSLSTINNVNIAYDLFI